MLDYEWTLQNYNKIEIRLGLKQVLDPSLSGL